MRRIIKSNYSIFFKSILLPIFLLAPMVYVLYRAIDGFVQSLEFLSAGLILPVLGVTNISFLGVLYYVPLLFVAYEYFYKSRNIGGYEVVDSGRGVLKDYAAKFIVIMSFISIFTVILICNFWSMYFYFSGGFTYYLWASFELLVLTFFVPAVVAVCIGAVIAEKFNRIKGYFLILAIVFFTTDLSDQFISAPFIGNVVAKIKDIFEIPTISGEISTMQVDQIYTVAADNHRWLLAIVWITLCAAVLYISKTRFYTVKRRAAAAVLIAVLVFTAWSSVVNPATVRMSSTYRIDSFSGETFSRIYSERAAPKDADFIVTDYNIDIRITDRLHCSVKMALERELKQYDFTLCDRYIVDSCTDGDGNPLEFYQRNNTLSVYSSGDIDTIVLSYSGFSREMFSNDHAVSLIAGFPYYPVPGIQDIISKGMSSGYVPIILESKSSFELTISGGPTNIFTNLRQDDDGVYRGTAQGVSIVGGPFVRGLNIGEQSVQQVDVSRHEKFVEIDVSEIDRQIDIICEEMGIESVEPFNPEEFTVFYLFHDSQILSNASFSDHCFLIENLSPEENIAQNYVYGQLQADRDKYEALNALRMFSSGNIQPHSDFGSYFDIYNYDAKIWDLVHTMDENQLISEFLSYINDHSDTRPYYVFLDDLFYEYAYDTVVEYYEQNPDALSNSATPFLD